jgi:hypothetical protein
LATHIPVISKLVSEYEEEAPISADLPGPGDEGRPAAPPADDCLKPGKNGLLYPPPQVGDCALNAGEGGLRYPPPPGAAMDGLTELSLAYNYPFPRRREFNIYCTGFSTTAVMTTIVIWFGCGLGLVLIAAITLDSFITLCHGLAGPLLVIIPSGLFAAYMVYWMMYEIISGESENNPDKVNLGFHVFDIVFSSILTILLMAGILRFALVPRPYDVSTKFGVITCWNDCTDANRDEWNRSAESYESYSPPSKVAYGVMGLCMLVGLVLFLIFQGLCIASVRDWRRETAQEANPP